MGRLDHRIAKLEAAMPDPEAWTREEGFRRSVAILNELERYVPLKDRDDLDRLVEESVPRALSEYGLSDEEIDEEAPAYVEDFKAMLRDLDAEEEGEPR